MRNHWRQRLDFLARVSVRLAEGFRDESGQALVPAAVMLFGALGFVGLAIDVGQMRLTTRQLQIAADAAAMAGALQAGSCQGTSTCAAMQTAAVSALSENGMQSVTVVQNCASSAASGIVLSLNHAPCALGPADPYYGNTSYVEAVVSETQPTLLAGLFGLPSVKLSARAEGGTKSPTQCMWALDPTGNGSLTVNGNANVSANCGIVVESNSPWAVNCNFFSTITATQIQLVGAVESFQCGVNPTPVHIALPAVPDPLAYLPKPPVGACGSSISSPYFGALWTAQVNPGQTAVFYPGTYCGGINIQNGATVTFMPGTYVITSSWNSNGLWIYCGANVTGTGVTFYNYGPYDSIFFAGSNLGGNVHLSAPTSGTYSGILFFQDPGNTWQATIVGTNSWNTVLNGAYYFPSATAFFAFNGLVDYSILVAKDIVFIFQSGVISGANNRNDFSSLANGSPLQKTFAGLVQ